MGKMIISFGVPQLRVVLDELKAHTVGPTTGGVRVTRIWKKDDVARMELEFKTLVLDPHLKPDGKKHNLELYEPVNTVDGSQKIVRISGAECVERVEVDERDNVKTTRYVIEYALYNTTEYVRDAEGTDHAACPS